MGPRHDVAQVQGALAAEAQWHRYAAERDLGREFVVEGGAAVGGWFPLRDIKTHDCIFNNLRREIEASIVTSLTFINILL